MMQVPMGKILELLAFAEGRMFSGQVDLNHLPMTLDEYIVLTLVEWIICSPFCENIDERYYNR